ncbi:hypothetical protein R5R35_000147 [Gryllus longicercus]|uniref:Iron-binding zinc finger CDGSH type domain-containing protein n=1 Tax=Gryllus longicercus TaxID=2509291 RepID=A0AAN9V541_9ORTH
MLVRLSTYSGEYLAPTLFKHFFWKNYARETKVLFSTGNILKKKNEDLMPKNPAAEFNSASQQSGNGFIYDKKPFKMICETSKEYYWCLCGRSKRQPLCDGTHKNPQMNIKLKPVKFTVTESKEYWLCNCKQTSNRPFCDGTHKREDVQAAVK